MSLQVEPTPGQSLAERFERLNSPAIADAQRGLRVVRPGISTIVPGCVIAGPVFTVRAYPGSLLSVVKGVEEAPGGSILVVDAEGDLTAGAIWGNLIAAEARLRGLKGIVIDGAVRDRRRLQAAGFPTFALGTNPRLGTNTQIGLTSVPISCGGVSVVPGDWLFADDDGLVVIPAAILETTLEVAETIEQRDAEVAQRLAAGERMIDVLDFRRLIYGEQYNVSVLRRPER
jgi:4-hydroxy-4-methyl-2-oxoglutarate aldolase